MGNLMIRNEKGIITHLGDRATAAVESAEKGEEVVLTVNGVRFSKIIDKQEIKL
jgi:antitoxin (DNA-binding transcriptional repressor) of toxin-antitoxin stability system